MSFDGSGVYSLLYTWSTEAASPPIAISKLDAEMAGLAAALSGCVLRNGTGKPTADIDWNAKKLTNLADATAATDALNRQTADARYAAAANYAVASSGSFTMELATDTSGGSVLASGTAYWKRIGNVVTLRMPNLYATTTDPTIFLRGIPAEIQPSLTGTYAQSFMVGGYVDGTATMVEIRVAEGVAYWGLNALAGFGSSNTQKGIGFAANVGPVITYHVAD